MISSCAAVVLGSVGGGLSETYARLLNPIDDIHPVVAFAAGFINCTVISKIFFQARPHISNLSRKTVAVIASSFILSPAISCGVGAALGLKTSYAWASFLALGGTATVATLVGGVSLLFKKLDAYENRYSTLLPWTMPWTMPRSIFSPRPAAPAA